MAVYIQHNWGSVTSTVPEPSNYNHFKCMHVFEKGIVLEYKTLGLISDIKHFRGLILMS